MNEIDEYNIFLQIIKVLQGVKQLSWTYDQTSKRYPAPESLTKSEIKQLTRLYLALGLDLEELSDDMKKIYEKYKKNEQTE